MKVSTFTLMCFILMSTVLVSCTDVRSSFLENNEKDFSIFIVPSLSKVFVSSSDLEVKAIKYCFYDSECKNWKNVSNFKLNKDKDRNIFELSNEDKFFKLHITTGDNTVSKKRIVELVVSRASGGSGGKTGKYEANYSNSRMSSSYKVVVPSSYSSSSPAGLIVYLHGDNAPDYYNDWLFKPVAEYANGLNIIAVSVKAPSSGLRWYESPKQNGDYLHDLIENKIFKDYNINKDRIYFTGTSGGSQFITGMIVSRYAGDYGGGAIPVCGGADIYSDGTAGKTKSITEKLKSNFKIFYYTGQADFLYSQTVTSKKSYSDLGLKVGSETYPGSGHCDRSVLEGVKKGFAFFGES